MLKTFSAKARRAALPRLVLHETGGFLGRPISTSAPRWIREKAEGGNTSNPAISPSCPSPSVTSFLPTSSFRKAFHSASVSPPPHRIHLPNSIMASTKDFRLLCLENPLLGEFDLSHWAAVCFQLTVSSPLHRHKRQRNSSSIFLFLLLLP